MPEQRPIAPWAPNVISCILTVGSLFDTLTEVKGVAKTSKPDPSAYRWYVRVRFVQ